MSVNPEANPEPRRPGVERKCAFQWDEALAQMPNVLVCVSNKNDGRFEHVNAAWKSLLGYELEELRVKPYVSFVHPDDVNATLEAAARLANGESIANFVNRYRCKDGSYRWILWNNAFSDEETVISIAQDVTALKESEDAARKAEEHHKGVIASLQEGVVVQDSEGIIIHQNPCASRILGLERDEAIGRNSADLRWRVVDENLRPLPADQHPAMQVLRTGEGVGNYSMGVFKPNGELRWLIVNSHPLRRFGESRPYGVVTSFVDVTEERAVRERLKKSEAQMRLITDSAPALISYIDRNFKYQFMNRKYEEWLGVSVRAAVGAHVWDVLGTEAYHRIRVPMERALSGESAVYEGWVEYSGLTPKWIRASYIPDRSESGTVLGIFVLVTDLTAQRSAEDQLIQSEKVHRLATKAAGIGTWEWIVGSETVEWSDVQAYLFGFPETVLNPRLPEILNRIHPEDQNRVHEGLMTAAEKRVPYSEEFRVLLPDGSIRWLAGRGQIVTSPESSRNGYPTRLFGVNYDITDEKTAQEVLEKSRARSQFFADIGQILSSGLGDERTFRRLAQAAAPVLCDYCFIDIVQSDGTLKRVAAEHRSPQTIKDVNLYRYTPPPSARNHVIWKAYDQRRTLLISPVTSADLQALAFSEDHLAAMKRLDPKSILCVPALRGDVVLGMLSFYRIESDWEPRAEEIELAEELARRVVLAIENFNLIDELRRSKEAAEAASALKSAFLANMSHEIRTPLGAMLGFADLLRDPNLSEVEKASYIEILTRSGDQLSRIINDILDLSKVEAGYLSLEYERLAPGQLIAEVVDLLSVKAQEKDIALKVIVDRDTPAEIVSDAFRIRQILTNIIGNAIKFTQKGSVVVRTRGWKKSGVVHGLRIEVTDTGIGVPEDKRDRLFQIFSQGDESTTRTYGGTGLGLALSRRLARALGGEVELVATHAGDGSVFEIRLADRPERIAHTSRDLATQCPVPEDGPNLREDLLEGVSVLVVEDAPDNQKLVSHYLKKYGACVDVAGNGLEGIEKVRRGRYDAVLMDIQMPVMDGYSATQKLRELGFTRPIIALTAHAMPEVHRKCLNVGCTDHLPKPINSRELLQSLVKYVRAH